MAYTIPTSATIAFVAPARRYSTVEPEGRVNFNAHASAASTAATAKYITALPISAPAGFRMTPGIKSTASDHVQKTVTVNRTAKTTPNWPRADCGPNSATGTNDAASTMPANHCHAKWPAPKAAMVAGRPPIARYRTTRNFGLIMAYLLVFFFAYIVIAYFVQWPKRKAACAGRPLFSEFWLWPRRL